MKTKLKRIAGHTLAVVIVGVIVLIAVAVIHHASAPRSYVAVGVARGLTVPRGGSLQDQGWWDVSFSAQNLKERFLTNQEEEIEGIAILYCYEFHIASPLGERHLKTFHRFRKIPLAEFHESINRDGRWGITKYAEEFLIFSRNGRDVNIVPREYYSIALQEGPDFPWVIHLEKRPGYFSNVRARGSMFIGTYRTGSEFSSVLSIDPIPEEFERQFAGASWDNIDLPIFTRR